MEPAPAIETDPFDVAMANLQAAGIEFEEVPDPPPDRTEEPPPGQEDGSQESVGVASAESVPESRRVSVGDWRRALLKADELGATARHVGLTLAEFMDRDGGGAFPEQATLAAACRRSVKTVREGLRAIESAGLLHVQKTGRASRYLATVPDGGEVVDFPPVIGSEFSSDRAEASDQIGSLTPTTQPPTQPTTQKSAAPSLTDDPEMYSAMLRLAEVSGARSPKAWIPRVFADDIAPIIEEEGRDAGLAEINRRIASKKTTHYAPEQSGHGETVATQYNW